MQVLYFGLEYVGGLFFAGSLLNTFFFPLVKHFVGKQQAASETY